MAGSPHPGEGRKRLLLLLRDARSWATLGVFVCAFSVALALGRDNGFVWAENDYLDDMDRIPVWASQLWSLGLRQGIADLTHPYWEVLRYWNPHPPLYKYLGIASRAVLPGVPFPTAERIPTMLLYAACCTVVFHVLLKRRGWLAGLVGAAGLLFMPRFASYSGYCTPDMPVAVSWLFIALAYERYEVTRQKWWLGLTAAIFAFAMGCKISALVMVPALGCLMLLWRARKGWREVLWGASGLALVLLLGLLALVVLFPFAWPAPISRTLQLFEQARAWGKEAPFSVLFFGEVIPYTTLPWYFTPVTLLLVTPPLTLALGLLGLFWPRKRDTLWQTLAVVFGFWLVFLLFPNTPKYDNERQILMLFPLLAMLAGMGAQDLLERLSQRVQPKVRPALVLLLGPMVVAVMALELLGAVPVPMSYYSEVVGGLPGAARLGFEPTYAMEVLSTSTLKSLEEGLPAGARLTSLPAPGFVEFLQKRGYLRPDIQLARAGGPFYLLVNRHNVFNREGSAVKSRGKMLRAYSKDGVPLAELWYLPQAATTVEH
jgi:Dolichyl-phosphate-mannose-protein mannosyltransferase